MRLLLVSIPIIYCLQACSHKMGDSNFYKAEEIKKDSFRYDSLKLDAFAYYVYADTFLVLNLEKHYKEILTQYQNTDSINAILIEAKNSYLNAIKKEKKDNEQIDSFLRKIKSFF